MKYTADDLVPGFLIKMQRNGASYMWYEITKKDPKTNGLTCNEYLDKHYDEEPNHTGVVWASDSVLYYLNMSEEIKAHAHKFGHWHVIEVIQPGRPRVDTHDWQAAYNKNRDKMLKELFGATDG